MKKIFLTLFGAALALSFGALTAWAQTGTVAKGPDVSVARDPEVERRSKKSLDAAWHYFKLKKAYLASLDRAEEILVDNPQFSKLDEALYIAGMSSIYLSEGKGKQRPPASPPEKAQEYTTERLRAAARFNLSRLVEEFPDSKFRKDAEKTLALLGGEKQ